MEESMAIRYWCHMCSRMVNPIMEVEVKCPFCMSGFVEEMGNNPRYIQDPDTDFGSDRALSLWASILLGMMGNSRRHRRSRRMSFEDDNEDSDDGEARYGGEAELNRELESIISRRRRNSATILQMLEGIGAGMLTESENSEGDQDQDRDRDRDGERERAILINPFNQTLSVQGSYDFNDDQNQSQSPIDSLGDYLTGPGLDLLLQHLAENDPDRYGTPPARKEAIEALPTVALKEVLQCSVCLDDFGIGTKAKEMPCKHKFHSECISPWLELHSSCPVCRYQLPVDESKLDHGRSRDTNNQGATNNEGSQNNSNHRRVEEGDTEGRNGTGRRFFLPWLLNNLFFVSSSSQTSGSNTSSISPSSSTNAPGNAYESDD